MPTARSIKAKPNTKGWVDLDKNGAFGWLGIKKADIVLDQF